MIKKIKGSQRFRVISNGTSFYTTAKNIRYGVGDFLSFNAAVYSALVAIEKTRSGNGVGEQCTSGICGSWNGVTIQLSML